MIRFLSIFEAGVFGAWLATRIKGIWRRRIAAYRDSRVLPRPLTLEDATEPEIHALRMHEKGRWLAIARTHIEEGFMAANRAVFKPARVALPEDGEAPPPAA